MSEPAVPTPPRSESFGRYLAQQRELRGLTLEQISDATKLSLSTLRALETEDAARLPERVFVVGAVRAYAKAVGLSPEETILRMRESWGIAPGGATDLPSRKKSRAPLKWMALLIAIAAAVGLALHFRH